MCRVLKVHRSGFYAWLKAPESQRSQHDRTLLKAIKKSYDESGGTYGSPRIHRDLMEQGYHCGRKRVVRLMTANKMVALRGYKHRRFRSGEPCEIAPNILERAFKVKELNRVWTTDITYIPCNGGWLFLAAIMDLCSRRIVGWHLSRSMCTDLVLEALKKAILKRRPKPGLILHSDQGSQFGSKAWRSFLEEQKIEPSMSRRGNCHDNAVQESFFSSLKMERIRKKPYKNLEGARQDIFDYIEMFYNSTRRHSYLGYISPIQYEQCHP